MKFRIFGIKICLRLLFRVQVIEIPEKFVEAMVTGQKFVFVTQVVFTKLTGSVTLRLKQLGNSGVFGLKTNISTGQTHLKQARAQWVLTGNKGRAARGAALLAVVIGKHGALLGDAIDIGGSAAQHTSVIGTDI